MSTFVVEVCVAAVALLLAGLLVAALSRGRARPDPQLLVIERKLDLIMEHFDIALPEPPEAAGIVELMRAGKKINAIKLYRERTGVGLKEAKDFVERLAGEQGTSRSPR
jgi:hypothetical protein